MALPELDIDRLSTDERIELAEALWESVRSAPEKLPLTAAQGAEIDRRVEAYREDQSPGTPWREVLESIRRRDG